MTPKEHVEFAKQLTKAFPEQKHYNLKAALEAISRVSSPLGMLKVTEVGGHDGSLANDLLQSPFNIQHWTNFDLVQSEPACKDPRYHTAQVDFDFYYDEPMAVFTNREILIATHMIEHLSDEDFLQFIKYFQEFPNVYFEAPLKQSEKSDWHDYMGTHILTYSWDTIEALMRVYGYRTQTIDQGCKLFVK